MLILYWTGSGFSTHDLRYSIHTCGSGHMGFSYRYQQSKRTIARYLGVSESTVRTYLLRAESAGLSWPLPEQLTDADLKDLLFPDSTSVRPQPNWAEVEKELSRKGMTLDLIWHAEYPNGYSYGYFCACYKKWRKRSPCMWIIKRGRSCMWTLRAKRSRFWIPSPLQRRAHSRNLRCWDPRSRLI